MLIETLDPVDPGTIRENNLRLPDAVTIVHGPRRLLARFFIAGDRAARQLGLHLRVRYDFDELLFLNRQEVARGNWRPLLDMFNPEHATLNHENAFWVSGENANGEIVATFGGRLYDWRNTNLAEQACAMFHGEDRGQGCIITAEAATRISGMVIAAGIAWVRPDYRRRHLSRLVPADRQGVCVRPLAGRLDLRLRDERARQDRHAGKLRPSQCQPQRHLSRHALGGPRDRLQQRRRRL